MSVRRTIAIAARTILTILLWSVPAHPLRAESDDLQALRPGVELDSVIGPEASMIEKSSRIVVRSSTETLLRDDADAPPRNTMTSPQIPEPQEAFLDEFQCKVWFLLFVFGLVLDRLCHET